MNFMQAMDIVEEGFRVWREKPHNAKWWARIDGTPIPNDLAVNIAEAMCRSSAARIEALEAALATCRELREYDRKEIERLRAALVPIGGSA